MNRQLLYEKVKTQIMKELKSGKWKPGDQLPGEQKLCVDYGVSRVTIRRAITDIVEEGYLIRLQGKGTFVTQKNEKIDSLKNMISFTKAVRLQGKKPDSKVLFMGLKKPDDDTKSFLSLDKNEPIFELLRIRSVDDIPVLIEKAHFKASFNFLESYNLTSSTYDILIDHDFIPSQSYRRLSIIYADQKLAQKLEVKEGDPLLFNRTFAFDQNGEPLHTVDQICKGDDPDIFQYYV